MFHGENPIHKYYLEGIDIADDLTTLVDGKIGVDDALAILDLAVGVPWRESHS
jgi:hypothetical protein